MVILLIEDDPVDAEIVERLLNSSNLPFSNYRLVHVDRLQKGIDHLTQGEIDVVLLDVALPDSRGLEGITRIKTISPEIPIVLLTGLDDEAFAVETLRHGVQDYLRKGRLDGNGLVRTISYSIERTKARTSQNRALSQQTDTVAVKGILSQVNQLLQGILTELHNLQGNLHDQKLVEKMSSDIISRTKEVQNFNTQIEICLVGSPSESKPAHTVP